MQQLKLAGRRGNLVQVSDAQESTGSRIRTFTVQHYSRMVNSCREWQMGNRKCRGRTHGWGMKAEVFTRRTTRESEADGVCIRG